MKRTGIYGMMAEFDSVHTLLDAANRTREAGYKKIDAYSPFPIEGLAEAIGFHHDEVPLVVLIGGIIGGLTGYLMQYWISVVSYPVNVGGKPYHSWPAFIVVVSLHRDFLTSSWGMYYPTRWDWMTYIGTIGLFLSAMFLFVRLLPMISIFEMRTLLPEAEVKE